MIVQNVIGCIDMCDFRNIGLDFQNGLGYLFSYLLTIYVASPVILSATQFFFDKMVYSFTYQQALYDSILTLGSLLGSKIVTNIFVAKTVGVLDNYYASNFISYIAEPLLNYIAYNYLYKEQFQKNYISKKKGDLAIMLMPIFQSIAGMFLDKAVVDWITGYRGSNKHQL